MPYHKNLQDTLTKEFLYEQYIVLRKNCVAIAKETGCTCSSVFRYIKKYGLESHNTTINKTLTKEYLYKQYFIFKKTCVEIAAEVGCTYYTIVDYLNKYGFKCSNHRKYGGYSHEEITGDFFSNIRAGTIKRNLEFNISIEELWELYLEQNKNCALTGIDLYFRVGNKVGNASLDRIDSNKGYTIDNIQWVTKEINKIKWDTTEEKLFFWCKKVALYDKTQYKENAIDRSTFKPYKKTGFGEISGSHWNDIAGRSKKRNIDFLITIEQVWELFLKQNKQCALTGEELNLNHNKKKKIRPTASLDRIDSNGDYTIDNIQWVHKDVNIMKIQYNQDFFIDICKKIYNKKIHSI